jgi:hypothetical protein
MADHDTDFGFTIDFKKGRGNPKRVFDTASALIDAFESFDKAVIASIGGKIEPTMVLDDVQSGSMKVRLRNLLLSTDDEALKSGDLKRIVGAFLIGAKYKALEFLKDEDGATQGLETLKGELVALAAETDVRYLPDYAPVHEGRLIASLDKIQKAKAELEVGDRLIVNLDATDYEVDLGSTWLPSEALEKEPSEPIEKENTLDMVLTVRKPDLIKDTMWQFSHGKSNLSASIKDEQWLAEFRARRIPILPGDALSCTVKCIFSYDEKGELIDQRIEIIKVKGVIQAAAQDVLPLY